jgi:carbon monoxide dehydrogenase subunit G
MELEHSFTVPAGVDETWATFMDLEQVGSCFPGATVTEASDEAFAGTVKVKLGPIALVYGGTGKFVERDDAGHRAVIEAKGKDKRGNGTAGATVSIQLTDAGDGATRADVRTDLSVTGKPAQFGRGVMQDVSDKLLGQFIACIEGKVGTDQPPAGVATTEPTEPATEPTQPATDPTQPVPEPATQPATQPAGVPREAATAPRAAPTPTRHTEDDAALDLGSTVLPVLLRAYARPVALALAVLAVVVAVRRAVRR